MTTIVRDNYPVIDLPEDLRGGLAADATVRIIVEVIQPRERVPSLEELFAMRTPTGRTMDDIVAEIRQQRDEWDG